MEYMGPGDRRKVVRRALDVHRRTGSPVSRADISSETDWVQEYTRNFAERLCAEGYIEFASLGDGTVGVVPKREAD